MLQPRYRFEPTPIIQRHRPRGGLETQLVDLSGRVVDTLTGAPVGVVIYSSDGTFVASNVLPGHGKIECDWGPRQDLAARATWSLYERSLPRAERWRRYCLWVAPVMQLVLIALLGGSIGSVLTSLLA